MNLEYKRYEDVCDFEKFIINGVPASYLDFGVTTDLSDSEGAGCGNRQFVPDEEVSVGVLKKYRITPEEAEKVVDMLRIELSMGNCKFCDSPK